MRTRLLGPGPRWSPRRQDVARELGRTSRTLRRGLVDHGTSFRRILDEVRANRARDFLSNSEITIDEIAGFLGYTETTNLRRAFKKSTGRAPSAFRSPSEKRDADEGR